MGLMTTTQEAFVGSTFDDYKAHFQYQDKQLFNLLFERNQERIKSKKVDVASANLKKIFEATLLRYDISSRVA